MCAASCTRRHWLKCGSELSGLRYVFALPPILDNTWLTKKGVDTAMNQLALAAPLWSPSVPVSAFDAIHTGSVGSAHYPGQLLCFNLAAVTWAAVTSG